MKPITLSDSVQEGVGHGKLGSGITLIRGRRKSNETASIILIIRCGGFASLRTVDMCVGFIV